MNITACYVIHGNNKSFQPVDDMSEKNINKNATVVARRDRGKSECRHCIGRKINFINIISKETESEKKTRSRQTRTKSRVKYKICQKMEFLLILL